VLSELLFDLLQALFDLLDNVADVPTSWHFAPVLEPARDRNPPPTQPVDQIEHDDRLPAMRALKTSEREALYLKALGYSYTEIMQLTGATYTAVNRRHTEGARRTARRPPQPQPVHARPPRTQRHR
jgi:DNA-directed RNA polymerase specialized sigma24 family protein